MSVKSVVLRSKLAYADVMRLAKGAAMVVTADGLRRVEAGNSNWLAT